MTDEKFIDHLLTRTREAAEKVNIHFTGLSAPQLNWKPAPERWSVAQCLEHLVVADGLYFPIFEKIANGTHTMNAWEKWSPLSRMFGRILVDQIQDKVKKKLKAPKIFQPSRSSIHPTIINRFQQHLDQFLNFLEACRDKDLDRIRITSPVSKIVTYDVRDALTLLTQHTHRHINQAIKVKEEKNFPK